MNIRENLVNSTQPALVVKAILIAIFFALIMAFVSWDRLKKYKTVSEITDNAAYELCIDKVNKEFNSQKDLENYDWLPEVAATVNCDLKWSESKSVKIEKPSFISFLFEDIDEV